MLFRVWFSFNSAQSTLICAHQQLYMQFLLYYEQSSNVFLDCFLYGVQCKGAKIFLKHPMYPKFGDLQPKWQSAGTLNSVQEISLTILWLRPESGNEVTDSEQCLRYILSQKVPLIPHSHKITPGVTKKHQNTIFEYWFFSQKSYLNMGCFENIIFAYLKFNICIPRICYLHTK